jgi:hypothetical protein
MNTDTLLLFVAILLFIGVNSMVNIKAHTGLIKGITYIGILVGIIAAWYLLGLSFVAYLPSTGGQP